MAMFNEQIFEKKLLNLKDTQDSISGLSSWCLQQPLHHKKIVQVWLQVLKKVKIEQRLSLFYLANDVIQYSKRKGYDFVESWGTALQRATTMVRGDDKVRTKVLRLFTIWNERNIYDESFLVDLVGLLSSRTPAQTSVPDAQDFQPTSLISKIRSCKALEDDTDCKLKIVNDSHLALSDADALRCSLKDRRHGEDVVAEVEDGIKKMEAYIKALEVEIKERQELIESLDFADVFYETQKGEARIVCNAYRNFGTRVRSLKRKLDELIPTLVSPIPSPDVNAPSPSPESDIDLPDDVKHGLDSMGMTSFIGTMVVPETLNHIQSSPESVHRGVHDPSGHHQPHHSIRNLEEVPIQLHDPELPLDPSLDTVPSGLALHHSVQQQHTIASPQHSMVPPPQLLPSSLNLPPTPCPVPSPHAMPPLPLTTSQLHSIPLLSHPPPPPPPIPPQHPPPFTSPLSSSFNQPAFPPLLGDGRDFPVNGGDSFLNPNPDNHSAVPPFLGTDLSFIGNTDFQFDFQKSEFSHNEKSEVDTPLSPPPENLGEDSLSDELAHNVSKEGNPIEVISSTTKNEPSFNLAEFLKSLMPNRDNSHINRTKEQIEPPVDAATPIMDPSVPPAVVDEAFPGKQWNSTLPPKFPSWSDSQPSWGEGMSSPADYKEGFGNSLDYEVPVPEESPDDIRNLPRIPPAVDIDHRNLISLTGSPLNTDNQWTGSADIDYRKRVIDNRDIVESVDMEMSDEEEPIMKASSMPVLLKPSPPMLLTSFHKNQLARKFQKIDTRTTLETLTGGGQNQSISFNISTPNKLLSESPLKEKDEPKKKLPLHKLGSPPKNVLNISHMMPPPPPPAALKNTLTGNTDADLVPLKTFLSSESDFNTEPSKSNSERDKTNNGCSSDPALSKPNVDSGVNDSVSDRLSSGIDDNSVDSSNDNMDQVFDNSINENDDEIDSAEQWNRPLLEPPLPLMQSPPSMMNQSPGFRPRGMRPPMQWRGPRRGMPPHRFRSPGPGGIPPHQVGNFQSPHMGPRSPFRGNNNNWRPRHW